MKKLAVLFPGIGYHVDKPLLYYGAKLAKQYDFEIVEVKYGEFPENIQGSKEKIQEAVWRGIIFAENSLKEVRFENYDEVVFISKSIGTAIAVEFAKKYAILAKQIMYTPLVETFNCESLVGIVIHGTNDPWAETTRIENECRRLNLPLLLIPNSNHSLELGNVIEDIKNLNKIMEFTEKYLC